MMHSKYEAVIGLEVHAELKTQSKIFCSCATDFGAAPNTHCCPVCMGLPGAMPVLNRRAVELAIMAGLALNCHISHTSRIDRKQYFYPDLPKAYQISQAGVPLCRDGYLEYEVAGETVQTAIERIHIEEDAGKLTHEGNQTLIDYNRCGIGLIEIVSRPTIRSGEEAAAYLRALRAVLVAIGVSDCKMQEGSMRCDVNVSVRPRGQSHLGVRTEIKNLNSFAFVEKAISYEIERHCQLLEQGEPVVMETRRFEPAVGKTFPLRSKERVSDYRFLLEPDLPVLSVHKSEIERIRCTLPELPRARAARLSRTYGIAQQDAAVLVSDAALAEYFETVAACTRAPGIALHMILTDLLRLQAEEHFTTTVLPERLGELADLLVDGVINSTTAKKLLLRLTEGDFSPVQVIEREDLAQVRDEATLCAVVEGVLAENLRAVKDYCHGKKAAMRALQGQAMAKTRGRADPVRLERILTKRLEAIRETEESI